jgi:hypothetical protein
VQHRLPTSLSAAPSFLNARRVPGPLSPRGSVSLLPLLCKDVGCAALGLRLPRRWPTAIWPRSMPRARVMIR